MKKPYQQKISILLLNEGGNLQKRIKYLCKNYKKSIVACPYVRENWCPHTCDFSANYDIESEMNGLEGITDS